MEKRGKRRFKKEIVLFALARAGEVTIEKLLGLVLGMGEITGAMMGATSKGESAYYIRRAATRDRGIHIDLQSKVALSMMISRLMKEGLIERSDRKISITKKGNETSKLSKFITLKSLPEGKSVLVIFDIPESPSGRRKRRWIRKELLAMEFEMIQKSVWRGNIVIPESFLEDIYELKLKDFVHIFEVTKHGTLEE